MGFGDPTGLRATLSNVDVDSLLKIAVRLFISKQTVTTHVTNMLNKLGLSSRIQLAGWVAGVSTSRR